tara:strand:+ start:813 stop:956 length:144 start_codon:yes stop_codon:yes gene_type:complete
MLIENPVNIVNAFHLAKMAMGSRMPEGHDDSSGYWRMRPYIAYKDFC